MKILKSFMKSKKFMFSMVILIPIILMVIFGPIIAPNDPIEMNAANTFAPSSSQYPLGTDEFGRCILSRILIGIRPSMVVALVGTFFSFAFGSLLGIVAGYLGGKTGNGIMRIVDIILCFPPILLAMMVVCLWGAGVRNLTIVVAILYMPHFTRISYSSTLKVRNMEYVENEISIGADIFHVLTKTIFPNIFSPLIIQISLTITNAILIESGLSFLGLGVQPPQPSWGQMIGDARAFLTVSPMYTIWPSLFLSLTILATNLMGDAMRDVLDPKLKDSF
ncbi:ABC transporter permease [Clostridium magnum]|uniref:Glutathione transport system permease protein GsiD n=1 Tax=Clostridium magnum DSM 2767 TaxID=1121326 RepID=A0A162QV10_9CLOT|nr:ABC transporter permease [Clostridium magnum]KZL89004.1 glutathione transport system permease protein GsiD [Clostridium magnum DSM 2767]SHI23366.1 peptide/nickel transport system permease protein [Clostridium magnum DSM 2767]